MEIIDSHLLKNCPVTRAHIIVTEDIFGTDSGYTQGNTVRRTPNCVELQYHYVPAIDMGQYRDVTPSADFMFVNGIPLFMSVSNDINFITCENTKNQKPKTIID